MHEAVPLPVLTREVFILSLKNEAFITEIFNHSAMRQSSAWGRVAGEAPVLWLIWRSTHCWWEDGERYWTVSSCSSLHSSIRARHECVLDHLHHGPYLDGLERNGVFLEREFKRVGRTLGISPECVSVQMAKP